MSHLKTDSAAGNIIEQVDLVGGRIIRKRHKTRKHVNVPVVNYKLWKPTLKLLKQFTTDKSDTLVLRNEDGGQLMTDVVVGGKRRKSDNVGEAFDRLKKVAGESKGFADLRSTVSTMLDAQDEFSRYAQFFLGQAAKEVARKHYVIPNQDRFDAAVEWLGQKIVPHII